MRFCSARSRRMRSLRSASLRFFSSSRRFSSARRASSAFGLLRLCVLLPPFEPLRLSGLPQPCVPLPGVVLLPSASVLLPASFLPQGVCVLPRVFVALLPNAFLLLSGVLPPDESPRRGELLPRLAPLQAVFARLVAPVPDALVRGAVVPDVPLQAAFVQPVALVRGVPAPGAVAPASPARVFLEPDVPLPDV